MCALYVRCALSVLQKECRKVWGARYMLGARYRSENTVLDFYSGTAILQGLTVKIIQEKLYLHNSKGNILWYLQIIRDHADYAHKSVIL